MCGNNKSKSKIKEIEPVLCVGHLMLFIFYQATSKAQSAR